MLKLSGSSDNVELLYQPPSGGCVLKHYRNGVEAGASEPAAFRRLCVETLIWRNGKFRTYPAAFRRLCVETTFSTTPQRAHRTQPPSGGCVLKLVSKLYFRYQLPSRLQAAVC